MSSDAGADTSTATPEVGTIDMKLEVVTVPVSDVDEAKRFYESLGWRLDIDLKIGDEIRSVQMTPLHSECSIHFGKGITKAAPGSLDRVIIVVQDIDAAREDLARRGVEISEVYDAKPPGFESFEGSSYFRFASFKDPAGNGWLLKEITTRLPGREWDD